MNEKLELYRRGRDNIWTNAHIAKSMLAAHLDPRSDAASRNAKTIEDTVAWIAEESGPGKSIIDLGCGPGLYAERFARMGYAVTGIDISANSISYAKGSARKSGLRIRYLTGNYLEDRLPDGHDVAICIYCDFGALIPDERTAFLRNAHRALNDGGSLFLDVFGEGINATKREGRGWAFHPDGGFWSGKPHYVLSETVHYPEAGAWGSRNVVVEGKKTREYITWDTHYSERSISDLLGENGFEVESARRGLVPKNDFASDDVLFVKARKA